MSLLPGTRLGPYDIVSLLGAGGMGEVYRATDTKLKREVAIKVLPATLVADAERLARFQREAEVLAALNHPNIAAIYGLEESDGTKALVMELVEGDDLSAHIARGPIALPDAIAIAKQIADALDAAHEQGIIHRDLKPANIKVRPDGTAKVLDFGLARTLDPGPGTQDSSNSPTLTARATQIGMIIGTAAYMAPEQARGKAVDRRADVWAFGVVLYEMLAGRRAFEGEDISVTLASVIKDEVHWQALPADLPLALRHLLRRCLEKDPRRRLRDIGEARVTLEDPASAMPATSEPVTAADASNRRAQPLGRRALPIVATAAIVSAMAWSLSWALQPAPPPDPIVTRFPLVLPAGQTMSRTSSKAIAVSPDGARIVYVANSQLYVREMADAAARPIAGTNVDPAGVFFAPDGQRVGFYSGQDDVLQTIAISGGSPVTVCKLEAAPYGASWVGDTILFSAPARGILRVSANGGDPEVLVKPSSPFEFLYGPRMVDEDRVMFTAAKEFALDRWDTGEVIVQSLATGTRTVVVRGGSEARYVTTGDARGHLLYAVGNTVRAVPFDLARLEVSGTVVPVVEQVSRAFNPALQSGVAQYDVSAAGMLAFIPGNSGDAGQQRSLALVGVDGGVHRLPLSAAPYIHPRVSPDGRNLAVAIDDGKVADVWVYDLRAGGVPRRLTFAGRNLFPIWARDGRYITYQSDRDGDHAVFRQLADGSGVAERLSKPEAGTRHEPESWSADGKSLTINLIRNNNQGVWLVSPGPQATQQAIVDTSSVEKHSTISPDGHWVAYMSNEGGRTAVYVQPFPPTAAQYQVSTVDGTRTPAWSHDGNRLFFHSNATNRFYMVDVRAEQSLTFGAPVPLPIEGTIHPVQQRNYDVMPDGKRLLVVLPQADAKADAARAETAQINVVLNWFAELKRLAPVKK